MPTVQKMVSLNIVQTYINKQRNNQYDQANIMLTSDVDKADLYSDKQLNVIMDYVNKHSASNIYSATSNTYPYNSEFSNRSILNTILSEPNSGIKVIGQDSNTYVHEENGERTRLDLITDRILVPDDFDRDNNLNQLVDCSRYIVMDYKQKSFHVYSNKDSALSDFKSGISSRTLSTSVFKQKDASDLKSEITGLGRDYAISVFKIREKNLDNKKSVAKCLINIDIK